MDIAGKEEGGNLEIRSRSLDGWMDGAPFTELWCKTNKYGTVLDEHQALGQAEHGIWTGLDWT